MMNSLYLYLRNLIAHEEGQDLVEYSMVFTLIALGTTAGMTQLSNAVSTVFSTVTGIINKAML